MWYRIGHGNKTLAYLQHDSANNKLHGRFSSPAVKQFIISRIKDIGSSNFISSLPKLFTGDMWVRAFDIENGRVVNRYKDPDNVDFSSNIDAGKKRKMPSTPTPDSFVNNIGLTPTNHY